MSQNIHREWNLFIILEEADVYGLSGYDIKIFFSFPRIFIKR